MSSTTRNLIVTVRYDAETTSQADVGRAVGQAAQLLSSLRLPPELGGELQILPFDGGPVVKIRDELESVPF